MSQHDYSIANQTAPNFRSDLNDALGAIATNNSGATEPFTTYANQWWYDTSNDILKIRSESDDAWINVGYLDQSNNEFKPYVGGTQVDTQSTATWEAGTSTTEGIVSPAKVKAAVDALVDGNALTHDDETKVGALAWCGPVSTVSVPINYGGLVSGSDLRTASAGRQASGGNGQFNYNDPGFSGTWKCLGYLQDTIVGDGGVGTLFVRIS